MSISSLLFTARDALNSNQMAIDITGSNIANVNTPGYSRQQVDLKSLGSVTVGGAGTQIGVTVSQIERIYDRFIESQIIAQQQNTGYSDTLLRGLQNIEVMIDDTQGLGISDQLSKFWSSWEDLSKNPGGIVERSALLSAAQNLTSSLTSCKRNLDTITTDLSRSIADTVTSINEKVNELKDLNKKIIEIMGDKGEKNDLLDKQTQALKELGALINITHVGNADGTANVYLSNGQPLLQGIQEQTLSAKLNADGQSSDIFSSNLSGETVNSTLTSGKLGALIELQNKIVPEYINDIDAFSKSLADRVNELHRDGFDAYNNTGVNFFQILDEENSAGTIQVNSAISADVNRIAVATSVNGNGDNASLIAAVQNELLMNNKTASLGSFLATIVGQIGQQVSISKTNNDRQTVIANLLGNQRESVSGVSIDEEMIRLINYQMGYNAAGKLVSVVDEILDTLMGIIK
jgi:flagellar hook-associated protein 1 FlgK